MAPGGPGKTDFYHRNVDSGDALRLHRPPHDDLPRARAGTRGVRGYPRKRTFARGRSTTDRRTPPTDRSSDPVLTQKQDRSPSRAHDGPSAALPCRTGRTSTTSNSTPDPFLPLRPPDRPGSQPAAPSASPSHANTAARAAARSPPLTTPAASPRCHGSRSCCACRPPPAAAPAGHGGPAPPDAILTAVDQLTSEDHADVTVTTAHSAKGREWPTVQIGDDFPPPKDTDQRDPRTPHPGTRQRHRRPPRLRRRHPRPPPTRPRRPHVDQYLLHWLNSACGLGREWIRSELSGEGEAGA